MLLLVIISEGKKEREKKVRKKCTSAIRRSWDEHLFFLQPRTFQLLSATFQWSVLRRSCTSPVLVWSCSTSISTPQSFGHTSARGRNLLIETDFAEDIRYVSYETLISNTEYAQTSVQNRYTKERGKKNQSELIFGVNLTHDFSNQGMKYQQQQTI